MSLLDALLTNDGESTIKAPCRVTVLAEGLQEPYLSAFLQLMNVPFVNGGVSPTVASAKAARAGLRIGETTIVRHRRALCGCERQVNA